MKKLIYLPILLLTLFVSVNKVSADNNNVAHFNDFYRNFDLLSNIASTYSSEIDQLIENFNNSSFGSVYDYYMVFYSPPNIASVNGNLLLVPTTDNIVYYLNGSDFPWAHRVRNSQAVELWYKYDIDTGLYSDNTDFSHGNVGLWPSTPILTNYDYVFDDENIDKFVLPSYSDNDYNFPSYELYQYDPMPTFETLTSGSYNTYTEIDLNSYDYVILSLNDYTMPPFLTNIYTLGKLCFTPVYNYGMTEKKDIFPTYKTPSCTGLYDTYTPVNISISQTDIDNHSVYYIKSYNSSAVNKIRVNTSKFNITYISSSNGDPQVEIGGRSYPVIPYNDLTDTANISTSEGYVSGQVCALGDVNCEYETGIGLDISELWTQPIKVLQSVWNSITSVFVLIGEFISLIPSPLKEFLISSFMLSIILGILKIIL